MHSVSYFSCRYSPVGAMDRQYQFEVFLMQHRLHASTPKRCDVRMEQSASLQASIPPLCDACMPLFHFHVIKLLWRARLLLHQF